MEVTTILLIGAGIILLFWLMIRFKLFKVLGDVLEAICDVFD